MTLTPSFARHRTVELPLSAVSYLETKVYHSAGCGSLHRRCIPASAGLVCHAHSSSRTAPEHLCTKGRNMHRFGRNRVPRRGQY